MEDKLDIIIKKLDELLKIARRIDKNTQPSAENNFAEYLLNVAGDITGDILMQGINKWYCGVRRNGISRVS